MKRSRWLKAAGLVLVKLTIVALFVIVPYELRASLLTVHGVVAMVLVLIVAVTLLVHRLRGRPLREAVKHLPLPKHRFMRAETTPREREGNE